MGPQVTGSLGCHGHWVTGLLGYWVTPSLSIHPLPLLAPSIQGSGVTWLAIHPRVMTTKPLIHPRHQGLYPSIQTRVKWLPIYPGSQGQGLHPSIQPGSGSQGIHPSKVTGHKTTDPQSHRSPGSLVTGLPIHPRPRSHLSIQTPGSWSQGLHPSTQTRVT
jgi:hypothetical protein